MMSEDNANPGTSEVGDSYRDYANLTENGPEFNEMPFSSWKGNFPIKLHYLLSDLEIDGLDDIVSWQPHGRCFVVHKKQEFMENILPL
jgi:hypothetical protein